MSDNICIDYPFYFTEQKVVLKNCLNRTALDFINGCDILYLDKSDFGKDENARKNHNVYGLARSNSDVKDFVTQLSNYGYYLVAHDDGISTFYSYSNKELYDGIFNKDNFFRYKDIYYSLEYPLNNIKPQRIIVVFSSVADFPYNSNIIRRCFFENFKNINKYIPYDTLVVRVADIGGVVGSFYMNNNFDLNFEDKIQEFLQWLYINFNIEKDNVVLYGVSKGGTGALLHGLLGEYKFISVDPIVSDDYHESKYNDSHFTKNTFPNRKINRFLNIQDSRIYGCILTSSRSPIFNDIKKVADHKGIDCIDVIHEKISDHPDVGPNTINILMMLLNGKFYNLLDSFETKIKHSLERLDESMPYPHSLYKEAVNLFNCQNYIQAYKKFSDLLKMYSEKKSDKKIPILYLLNESHFQMSERKNLPRFKNDKFTAESFVGIKWYVENVFKNYLLTQKIKIVIDLIKKTDENLFFLRDSILLKAFNDFIIALKKIDINLIKKTEIDFLFFVANLSIFSEDYEFYTTIRRIAAERAVDLNPDDIFDERYKLAALIENSNYYSYNKFIDVLKNKYKEDVYKKFPMIGVGELYFGFHKKCIDFFSNHLDKYENDFKNFVENKSVAIVGPVNSGLSLGTEIDSFDIIIRMNYKGFEKYSPDDFGTRTDISFYISKDLVGNREIGKIVSAMNSLKWLVCDANQNKGDKCFNGVSIPIRPRFKAGHPGFTTLFKGTNNGVQRIIADIMRFNVRRVKIFNMNLFLDRNSVDGYRNTKKNDHVTLGFIRHDPIGNFIFMKNMYKAKVIEVDPVLSSILDLNESDYMAQLAKSFGFLTSQED